MADPKPFSQWANSQFPPTKANDTGSPNGRASRFANDNGYFNNGSNGNGHSKSNGNGIGNGTPTTTPPPLYTARAAPRTPRNSVPTKILGSIAEDGGMSPDIPIRNPQRRSHSQSPPSYHTPRAFVNHYFPTLISPPSNDLENVTGPRGEKLNDARENRRSRQMPVSMRGKQSMRRFICIGMVIIILAAMVAIGLVIGLKRMHKGNRYGFLPLRVFVRLRKLDRVEIIIANHEQSFQLSGRKQQKQFTIRTCFPLLEQHVSSPRSAFPSCAWNTLLTVSAITTTTTLRTQIKQWLSPPSPSAPTP